MSDGMEQRVTGPRRAVAMGLVWMWMTTGCADAAQEWDDDDTGDAEFRANDPEPMDLEVESSSLAATNGKPSYPPCPACGRIAARGLHYVDVDLKVPGNLGYVGLTIGLDQEGITPAAVEWEPTSMNIVGSVRLRTSATIRPDAALQIWGWKPDPAPAIVPFPVEP